MSHRDVRIPGVRGYRGKSQVICGVIETDIANHFSNELFIVREFAAFDFSSE
jgi:hypothetical protein